MLTVETIRKIRLAVHRDGKSIRKTAKDLCLSRNTVRKVIRSDQTAFEYKRRVQPHPRLGDHINLLEERLSKDHKLPKKQRRTAQMLYEGLQLEGYEGGYDAVRRHVKRWRQDNGHTGVPIKGRVKRKNTSPMKKTPLFFRLALSSPQHGIVLAPISHPLFRSYWFAVQPMLIRTSHTSGSRRLCCKRNS